MRWNTVRSEWVLGISLESLISRKTGLNTHDVQFLCDFFEDGKEVAYIYRYKLDNHEHLDLEQVRYAKEMYNFARNLNKGVNDLMNRVLPTISNREEKEKFKERMRCIRSTEDLEDMEHEFNRPSLISQRADKARELGLEPIVEGILKGEFVKKETCEEFQLEEKEFMGYLRALIADTIIKNEDVKKVAKKVAVEHLWTKNFVIISSTKKRDGFGHRERFYQVIPSEGDIHVISKLDRRVEHNQLEWSVEVPRKMVKEHHPMFGAKVHEKMQRWFDEIMRKEIGSCFLSRIARKAKSHLQNLAKQHGCRVHRENLFQLFKLGGVRGTYVIGLDPGFEKTKAALIDNYGKYLGGMDFRLEKMLSFEDTKFYERDEKVLMEWVEMAKADGKDLVFAVGNGMNHLNVQKAVWGMKYRKMFEGVHADVYIVSETGASWHSVSDIGINEFPPGTPPGQISAASIARRLQAPKSEYSKLPPHKLSLGQYQNSMPAPDLVKNMDEALRERISLDGVDLNLASIYVLRHVCGLDEDIARDIVKYREEHGVFLCREELKNVVTEEVFEQCAGFLKIENGQNPLDNTFVHPNDYEQCERMLDNNYWTVEYLQTVKHPLHCGLSDAELNYVRLIQEIPESAPAPKYLTAPLERVYFPLHKKIVGKVRCWTTWGVFINLPLGMDSKTDGVAYKDFFRVGNKEPAEFEFPKIGEEIEVLIYRIETKDEEQKFYIAPPDRVPDNSKDYNNNRMKRRSIWRW